MTVTLLAITDGRRECLQRTLETFDLCVDPRAIDRRVIVNDCPDVAFSDWVDSLGFDDHVRPLGQRRGFGGAIAAGWGALGDTDYVFHLEDDFVFQRHVDVRAVIDVLSHAPHLAQMALRRQPWNEDERAAGGIVEQHPHDYVDRHDDAGRHWLEHRRFFTTNPCVYPAWVVERGWPIVDRSEGIFSLSLFQDPQAACGFWGKRAEPPWVHHIGEYRIGKGY